MNCKESVIRELRNNPKKDEKNTSKKLA